MSKAPEEVPPVPLSSGLSRRPSLVLSPDCIDSRYDQERVRASLGLANHYVPVVVADRYHLLERIARGSVGSVYHALDGRLGRQLAIKVINGRNIALQRLQRRLVEEGQALARIRHENVLVVYDVGETDDHEYFVTMDYVHGTTLRSWQKDQSLCRILEAYIDAGRGLAAAHQGGVIHRDFKPDNVLVSENQGDRRVVVGDFGLASISAEFNRSPPTPEQPAPSALGTLAYMPPEQHDGRAEPRCDQYAFCVSLWEAATGHRPFPIQRAKHCELTNPPEMPLWLYECLSRGLAWLPEQRYPDMNALLSAIAEGQRQFGDHEPERPPSHPLIMMIAVFAGLTIILGLSFLYRPRPPPLPSSIPPELYRPEPYFRPLVPWEDLSPGSPPALEDRRSRKPAAGQRGPTARVITRRACTRDTFSSYLSSIEYSCQGTIDLDLDERGLVKAPDRPTLHGKQVPGSHESCTMRVKCPDDEYRRY